MSRLPRRQHGLLKELLIGFCLGTANIIPGVSGGTFLLVFKIYERVFAILGSINGTNIRVLVSKVFTVIFKPGKDSLSSMTAFLAENDFIFLLKLVVGAMVAIVSLSSLMKYLILNQFSFTYALFFGLILLSVVIPARMLTHKKTWLVMFVAAGALATIYLTASVDPYRKTKMKSDFYEKNYAAQVIEALQDSAPGKTPVSERKFLGYTGKYTVNEYMYAGFCGAVSISAMVLPGVSGSLVMILMGQYFEVVSAISDLKILNLDAVLFLTCFALGTVFGGLFFARLISVVLKRYYNATMAFLIGLMIGSLYALWPFKKSVVMARQFIKKDGVVQMLENTRIYTNVNVLPEDMLQLVQALPAFICGALIMFFFIRREKRD